MLKDSDQPVFLTPLTVSIEFRRQNRRERKEVDFPGEKWEGDVLGGRFGVAGVEAAIWLMKFGS